jgi:protein CpxP
MNRLRKIAVVITIVGLAGLPALAQNGSEPPQGRGRFGPPPGAGIIGLERLAGELGLSDAQKTQIGTLVSGERESLRATMTSMRQAEHALAAAVMQVPADDNAIQARASELSGFQGQLTLARAQLESRIYQLLTPEQQQKAQQFVAQMQQRGGRRGGDR